MNRTVYKKCSKCRKKFTARTGRPCEHCGHVTRKPWTAVVNAAPTGAPRQQLTKGGFTREDDAKEWAANQLADAQRGVVVKPSKETVGEYLERWLTSVRPSMRERSWDTAEEHVRLYLKLTLGPIVLQRLDRVAVKAAYAKLEAEGRRDGGPLAASTVHRAHTTLRSAMQDAVEDGLLRSNPADRAHTAPTHGEQEEVETWTADELATFLDWSARHQPDWRYVAWWLLAHSGLRRGEAARLTWRDVDLDAGTVTVRVAKTPRGRRTIDLDPATVNLLREHRGATSVVVDLHGHRVQPVFGVRADSFTQAWDRSMARAGVRRVKLHALRHTHATLLLAAGTPLHVVSRRLGHANEAFTAEVYAHVLPQQGQQAADTFALLVQSGR